MKMKSLGLSRERLEQATRLYAVAAIVLDSAADRLERSAKWTVELLRMSAEVYGGFGEMMGALAEANDLPNTEEGREHA